MTQPNLEHWQGLAERELRGKPLAALHWQTPEGIEVKPLYTAADLENLSQVNSLPGLAPFVRGPRATMYANRPWTIRQYAGFSTAEESNRFYRDNLAAGQKGCRSPSTWPPTGAMTRTIPAWPGMWARPGWP